MSKYTLYQIDSFTKEQFKGNPAGVVLNADGLSDNQMQLIARELNNSETAFVLSSKENGCDGEIRYFTPSTEVPICGHATIAAMYAKATKEKLETSIYRIKTKVGILPFEVIKINNNYKISMTQGEIKFEQPFEETIKQNIINALGLKDDDLIANCPIQIVSTGHSKVMIGIKSRTKLNNLTPNFHSLSKLSNKINCKGYFVFTFDSPSKDTLTYGRMFAPAIGINEDPVTGNAHGPLGAYLVKHRLIDTLQEETCFKGKQGEAINRLGTVEVKVTIKDDKPLLVKILGEAMLVFETEITI